MLCLRKENAFFGKCWLFPRKQGIQKYVKEGEKTIMKNNNQINVPQAREAMDKFKMQAAQDLDDPATS